MVGISFGGLEAVLGVAFVIVAAIVGAIFVILVGKSTNNSNRWTFAVSTSAGLGATLAGIFLLYDPYSSLPLFLHLERGVFFGALTFDGVRLKFAGNSQRIWWHFTNLLVFEIGINILGAIGIGLLQILLA